MTKKRSAGRRAVVHGGGAIAQGKNASAVGERGVSVAAGARVGGPIITGDVTVAEDAAYRVSGTSPYLGLQPFTYANRETYTGRLRQAKREAERIMAGELALVFVTGASGSGKSSFAQAGLIPQLETLYLERRRSVARAVLQPGQKPLRALARALETLGIETVPARLGELDAAGFAQLLGNAPRGQVNLLVIDQFEELFTQSDPAERDRLVGWLAGLPPVERSRTHIIATLRSDYLGELYALSPLWDIAVRDGFIELRAMSAAELKEVIQRPLEKRYPAGDKRFEPALLDRLAADAARDAALLPLLQVTLDALWKGGELRLARYQNGLDDAIGQRADRVWGYADYDADPAVVERPPADRAVILDILTDLVRVSADGEEGREVRIPRTKKDLERGDPARKRLIKVLIDARLLSGAGDRGTQRVTIIHESLIHRWERLRGSLSERRQLLHRRARFDQQLKDWRDNKRDPRYLLGGVRLEEARELDREDDVTLRESPDARELLRLSDEQANEELRRAQEEQARLERALNESKSRELAAVAASELERDPERALLVAIDANKNAPTFETRDVLLRAMDAFHLVATLRGHTGPVISAFYSPAGDRIVSAGLDGTCRLWGVDALAPLLTVALHTPRTQEPHDRPLVFGARFSPDGGMVASAGSDGAVRLWDARSGAQIACLNGHNDAVSSVDFSPDGNRLASAAMDGVALLWDVAARQPIRTLSAGGESINGVRYSRDGRLIAAACDDRADIWDADGNLLRSIVDFTGTVQSVDFSPDAARLVTSGGDGARVWDVATGRPLMTLLGHSASVAAAVFSPDGALIVTAGEDRTARLWQATDGRHSGIVLRGHTSPVMCASFSPDGAFVLTASIDGTLRVWDTIPDQSGVVIRAHDGIARGARFNRAGDRFVSAGHDGRAIVWDVETLQRVRVLQAESGGLNAADFSPDGTRIVAAGDDRAATIWDVAGGGIVLSLLGHTDVVNDAAWSRDGARIATAGIDGTARIWNAASGAQLLTLVGHGEAVNSAAFSPDGSMIVTTGEDNTARLWNSAGGALIRALKLDGQSFNRARFSPDGRRLVTASGGSDAQIWDVRSGELIQRLQGHASGLWDADFSNDGRYVATASRNGSVRAWDLDSGEVWPLARGKGDSAYAVQFSPDGDFVLVACFDGTLRLFSVWLDDVLDMAEAMPKRQLTLDEQDRLSRSPSAA